MPDLVVPTSHTCSLTDPGRRARALDDVATAAQHTVVPPQVADALLLGLEPTNPLAAVI